MCELWVSCEYNVDEMWIRGETGEGRFGLARLVTVALAEV